MTALPFLRDPIPEDLPALFVHQRDLAACEMAAFKSRERDAFFAHWTKILNDDSLIKKTITLDGAVAGHIGSFEQDGKREIGYWLGREYWGRGLGTAAIKEFLTIETRRPLYAHVAEHNLASIRALEKCGFRQAARITPFAESGGKPVAGVAMILE
jgi:RimJ/RimL family protein N-acetyltransferase